MLRSLILFPVKLPYRIARFAYHTLTGAQKTPPPSARTERPAPPPPERPAAAKTEAPVVDPRTVQTSPEEIFELQKQGIKVVFVDVRELTEMSIGVIDGAILMPSGQV